MNPESWKLWKHSRRTKGESLLLRYGIALLLPVIATLVVLTRPALDEAPFFIFLAGVVLSAAHGGLAPAFLSLACSALLIRVLFVHPNGSAYYGSDYAGMERMGAFVLIAMLLSSFVAAIRTERNQYRDSEARYRMLAETASDAIIVIDEKGEILYVNPVAERVFGSRSRELLGQNLRLLLPGDGYQSELAEMKRQLDSRRKTVALQLPGLHKSGEHLLVEMTLGMSSHRGRNLFTAILRDITGQER